MTRMETRPGSRSAPQPSPYASVRVRPETIIYAIRYCLGRATYASADGAALAIEHAALIRARGWADVTVRDIDEMLARPHPASVATDLDRWREARAALHWPDVVSADRAPRRIRLSRAKGWRKPEGAVVVSRPSKWGNPWKVGEWIRTDTPAGSSGEVFVREFDITPEIAVALYRAAFTPDAAEIRAELAGRDLACWCPLDQPCHADVLLEIANGPTS